MLTFEGKYTSAKVMIDNLEDGCSDQIIEFLNHPAFTRPISIMPDCHVGMGCVIGFTMPMTMKVIPNTIGVDISCGILSVNVGKDIFANITKEVLDHQIRRSIPFGFNTHKRPAINMERDFPWNEAHQEAKDFIYAIGSEYINDPTFYTYDVFKEKCKQVGADIDRAQKSLGTLGGGNHFIEIGQSQETGDYWITVHSGSRNFGLCICKYWQDLANKTLDTKRNVDLQQRIKYITENVEDKTRIETLIQEAKHELGIGDKVQKNLTYLTGDDMIGYLFDMIFAQKFAEVNRATMMNIILDILKVEPGERIESVHNYIDFEDFVIRKGAIRSVKGEKMVIPFNMRDGILICEGKSNPEWNYSAPHGAGRVLSRTKAKDTLNIKDFEKQMEGVFSTSVGKGTLDEAPDAYKPTSVIEAAIEPTAEIIDRIKPVMNLKDKGKKRRKRRKGKRK